MLKTGALLMKKITSFILKTTILAATCFFTLSYSPITEAGIFSSNRKDDRRPTLKQIHIQKKYEHFANLCQEKILQDFPLFQGGEFQVYHKYCFYKQVSRSLENSFYLICNQGKILDVTENKDEIQNLCSKNLRRDATEINSTFDLQLHTEESKESQLNAIANKVVSEMLSLSSESDFEKKLHLSTEKEQQTMSVSGDINEILILGIKDQQDIPLYGVVPVCHSVGQVEDGIAIYQLSNSGPDETQSILNLIDIYSPGKLVRLYNNNELTHSGPSRHDFVFRPNNEVDRYFLNQICNH